MKCQKCNQWIYNAIHVWPKNIHPECEEDEQ